MISEDRVKHMTRMAIFEKEMGPKYQPMLHYSRKSYVSAHGIGAFFAGSIFFLAVYIGIVALLLSTSIDNLNTVLIFMIVIIGLTLYAVYIVLHVAVARKKAKLRYKEGKKLIKDLQGAYDILQEMYDEEDRSTMPVETVEEWE